MQEDLFRVTPERLDAANKLNAALADLPPDDVLFVLAMAAAAVLKRVAPDPGEEDTAFEGFMKVIWTELTDDGPPNVQ
ncbi:MAG: hypothetical protein K0R27_340 [Xanthobacteraceae bacterium]|jgi:hypothetical protein|nr:hypothetical protein [Xanthobacteraceae bacterium]